MYNEKTPLWRCRGREIAPGHLFSFAGCPRRTVTLLSLLSRGWHVRSRSQRRRAVGPPCPPRGRPGRVPRCSRPSPMYRPCMRTVLFDGHSHQRPPPMAAGEVGGSGGGDEREQGSDSQPHSCSCPRRTGDGWAPSCPRYPRRARRRRARMQRTSRCRPRRDTSRCSGATTTCA